MFQRKNEVPFDPQCLFASAKIDGLVTLQEIRVQLSQLTVANFECFESDLRRNYFSGLRNSEDVDVLHGPSDRHQGVPEDRKTTHSRSFCAQILHAHNLLKVRSQAI